jgi:hypothetical protein
MRLVSIISLALISTSTLAANIKDPYAAMECPKMSLDQVVQVVKSGKILDSMPQWLAFAQPVVQGTDAATAKSVVAFPSYQDSDGNVICKYQLNDANNKAIYELALMPNYGVNEEPSER